MADLKKFKLESQILHSHGFLESLLGTCTSLDMKSCELEALSQKDSLRIMIRFYKRGGKVNSKMLYELSLYDEKWPEEEEYQL